MQTTWIKKDNLRVDYCHIEKQEPHSFKIYSGIVGTDLEIQTIESNDASHSQSWLDSKLSSLKRKGFVPALSTNYTSLTIRYKITGTLSTNEFQHKETFKKILNELFRSKGLGYIMGGALKTDYWEVNTSVLDAAKAKELINYTANTFGYEGIELLTPVTNPTKQ